MRLLFGLPVEIEPTDASELTDASEAAKAPELPVENENSKNLGTLNDALHANMCTSQDATGATPLHKAAYNGHDECVKLLVRVLLRIRLLSQPLSTKIP